MRAKSFFYLAAGVFLLVGAYQLGASKADAQAGDMLIAISTSGNSANVLRAVASARERDVFTVGLLGGDGGELARQVDLPLIVGSSRTARIQEAHIFILHVLCEIFEAQL